jgi:hypothetical protein
MGQGDRFDSEVTAFLRSLEPSLRTIRTNSSPIELMFMLGLAISERNGSGPILLGPFPTEQKMTLLQSIKVFACRPYRPVSIS